MAFSWRSCRRRRIFRRGPQKRNEGRVGIDIEIKKLIGVGLIFCPNFKETKYSIQLYFECFTKSNKIKPASDLVDVKWVKGKEITKYIKGITHLLPTEVKNYLKKLS